MRAPFSLLALSCVLSARQTACKGSGFYFCTRTLERSKGNIDSCRTAAPEHKASVICNFQDLRFLEFIGLPNLMGCYSPQEVFPSSFFSTFIIWTGENRDQILES